MIYVSAILMIALSVTPSSSTTYSTANQALTCTFKCNGPTSDTHAPTGAPSKAPSSSPTKSKSPSKAPSKAPSSSPTKSKSPSKSPSKAPSSSPTKSKSPSKSPSKAPSSSPTKSKSPSKSPSKAPSNSPTTFFDATALAAGEACKTAMDSAFQSKYADVFGSACKKPTYTGSVKSATGTATTYSATLDYVFTFAYPSKAADVSTCATALKTIVTSKSIPADAIKKFINEVIRVFIPALKTIGTNKEYYMAPNAATDSTPGIQVVSCTLNPADIPWSYAPTAATSNAKTVSIISALLLSSIAAILL